MPGSSAPSPTTLPSPFPFLPDGGEIQEIPRALFNPTPGIARPTCYQITPRRQSGATAAQFLYRMLCKHPSTDASHTARLSYTHRLASWRKSSTNCTAFREECLILSIRCMCLNVSYFCLKLHGIHVLIF